MTLCVSKTYILNRLENEGPFYSGEILNVETLMGYMFVPRIRLLCIQSILLTLNLCDKNLFLRYIYIITN